MYSLVLRQTPYLCAKTVWPGGGDVDHFHTMLEAGSKTFGLEQASRQLNKEAVQLPRRKRFFRKLVIFESQE